MLNNIRILIIFAFFMMASCQKGFFYENPLEESSDDFNDGSALDLDWNLSSPLGGKTMQDIRLIGDNKYVSEISYFSIEADGKEIYRGTKDTIKIIEKNKRVFRINFDVTSLFFGFNTLNVKIFNETNKILFTKSFISEITGGATNGTGGSWAPGTVGRSPGGAYIYIPRSYAGTKSPSSVVFLWNSKYSDWQSLADSKNLILIDTYPIDQNDTIICNGGISYHRGIVDQKYILNLIAESRSIVFKKYNIDTKKIYYGGSNHGGNLAMKFGSIPSATTLALDDTAEVICSTPPSELLELQKAAHVGQREVAGTIAFPGDWGSFQKEAFIQTNSSGGRRACFAYVVGDQDTIYKPIYSSLIPQLQSVTNYASNIYFKEWVGFQGDIKTHTNDLLEALTFLQNCPP